MVALGLTAVGGLTALLLRSWEYSGRVRKQNLANREFCRFDSDPRRSRLEFELLGLGLMPGDEVLRTANCLGLLAQLDPQLGTNPCKIGPSERLLVVLYQGFASNAVRERLLKLLTQIRQQQPAGIVPCLLADVHPDGLLALYSADTTVHRSWSSQTVDSYYSARRIGPEQAQVFLEELGQALQFAEAHAWNQLGNASDLGVDAFGRPALVLGTALPLDRHTRTGVRAYPAYAAAVEALGPNLPARGTLLDLWLSAGYCLCQSMSPQPEALAAVLKKALENSRRQNFGQLFESLRAELRDALV
jgi:hypothetical protein